MPDLYRPMMRELAQRLLVFESGLGKTDDRTQSAAFRVCEKLRAPLSKILGVGGFRSILSRALVLATTEVSWLGSLQIKEDGSLDGIIGIGSNRDLRELVEGEIVLVAHLLGLLETFIGPALTLRVLCSIFGQSWTLKNVETKESYEEE